MGIRVDEDTLDKQLTEAGCDDRRELPFQKAVLNEGAALYHRRWYRTVTYLYVLPSQGTYRGSPCFSLARGDPGKSSTGRHTALIKEQERGIHCEYIIFFNPQKRGSIYF